MGPIVVLYGLFKLIITIMITVRNVINIVKEKYLKKSYATIALIWSIFTFILFLDFFIFNYFTSDLGMIMYMLVAAVILIFIFVFDLNDMKKICISIETIVLIFVIGMIIFFTLAMTRVNSYVEDDYKETDSGRIKMSEIEAYNSDYEAYFGEFVSPANTKALIQKVKSHNSLVVANKSLDYKKIYFLFDSEEIEISDLIKKIKSSRRYMIYVVNDVESDEEKADAGYYKNGYIKTIAIEEIIRNEDNTVNNTSQSNGVTVTKDPVID